MKILISLFFLFSQTSFAENIESKIKRTQKLQQASGACSIMPSLFEREECYKTVNLDAHEDYMKENCSQLRGLKWGECRTSADNEKRQRDDAFSARLEQAKENAKTFVGKKFLSYCHENSSRKPLIINKECEESLKKAVLGATEIEFCKNESDVERRKKCFVQIADRSYRFEALSSCMSNKFDIPSLECLSTFQFKPFTKAQQESAKEQGRSDCQDYVPGSYIICPEGKYVFQKDLTKMISNKKRAAKDVSGAPEVKLPPNPEHGDVSR